MISDTPEADYLRHKQLLPRLLSPEPGQLSRRRDTQTTSGSIVPQEVRSLQPPASSLQPPAPGPSSSPGSPPPAPGPLLQPRVPSSSPGSPPPAPGPLGPGSAACTMTSGEFMQTAPLLAHTSRRSLLYKGLCFLLLVLQGAVLDFYLIVFTDLYWCSWIATDVVVVSGWGIFFMKNARSKRQRACGFQQKTSVLGCGLGDFTYAYLAWLIYVIACTPKVVLILETSILDLVELKVPCGLTGFKVVVLLSAPLLCCLLNAITEDLNGATRHHSHSCFTATCLDLLDSFTLVEMLLRSEIPSVYLQYTVVSVYFVALSVPVVWLYELTASELRCRWLWARFSSGFVVNAPLLVVRCFQVYVYTMPVSVFMFKNIFFLVFKFLELVEQCVAMRGVRRLSGGNNAAQFSHCVSENDMCPHGYVNTLAVTQS
ncbi:transmembrane protein 121B [Anoplopoma fimbria]|uniref:transmembrane protein 121B n=1 Tax=Anoplopoma fimbria TaxID=229290 RepID=UPI0023EBDBFB|nr:transmembrane protein 121B [Anoplopoma fimbria]